MALIDQEGRDFERARAEEYGGKLAAWIKEDERVGDLLSLDYTEATVLVHDAQRQEVGGLPMGCFLLATRVEPDTKPRSDQEDNALI